MDELTIPIFAKAYDLYKLLCGYRNGIPKQDRHTLWQRIEELSLTIIESLLLAGQRSKPTKVDPLERASVGLNLLRVLLRLARDTKAIDLKKYTQAQQSIDEIGRMLGGWIKSVSTQNSTPPPRGIFKEVRRKCRTESDPTLSLAFAFQLLKLS